jgi:CPA1 family monovalent cation:H+ antiporter
LKGFHIASALLVFVACASYVNHRFLQLPSTIGMMIIAMLVSLIVVVLSHVGVVNAWEIVSFVRQLDFGDLLLHAMLPFLLFAGALHIDLDDLKLVGVSVALLSTFGVALAALVCGGLFWVASGWLGLDVSLLSALMFGALIAPTDPIAVMGILKHAGAPKRLAMKITGEALFNDGVAVVMFVTLLGLAKGKVGTDAVTVTLFLLREIIGGVCVGGLAGWMGARLLQTAEVQQVEVLLTLALVAGVYSVSEALHVSAPIAVVLAGLLIADQRRTASRRPVSQQHLHTFWGLLDEVLNAILFVLIGLEIAALDLDRAYLVAGLFGIASALLARFVSVALPLLWLKCREPLLPGTLPVLTWGGLRGGVSIALALLLPPSPQRDLILAATYIVVIFSVLVQGLSLGYVVRAVCDIPRNRDRADGSD